MEAAVQTESIVIFVWIELSKRTLGKLKVANARCGSEATNSISFHSISQMAIKPSLSMHGSQLKKASQQPKQSSLHINKSALSINAVSAFKDSLF